MILIDYLIIIPEFTFYVISHPFYIKTATYSNILINFMHSFNHMSAPFKPIIGIIREFVMKDQVITLFT